MAAFLNYNDTTPAAPGGYVNVKWQKDTAANISAYVPVASSGQTPWTQDVDAAGHNLKEVGNFIDMSAPGSGGCFFHMNAYYDGSTYRYGNSTSVYAGQLSSISTGVRLVVAAPAAADSVVSWVDAFNVTSSVMNIVLPMVASDSVTGMSFIAATGACYVSGGLNPVFKTTGAGSVVGKLQALDHTSIYLGSESNHLLNFIVNNSVRGSFDTDGLFSLNAGLKATNLPSSNPGAGSKQFWYDPADSNRVKFAA